MSDKVFAALAVFIAIMFVTDCIYKICFSPSLEDDGWKKVREEGDFIVYSKRSWFFTKPCELRVLKKEGKPIHFHPYFDPKITNQKDKKVVDSYTKLMQDVFWSHMSYTGDTIWLYRDELMNDEFISKVQDVFASAGYKVKIVYDWKD